MPSLHHDVLLRASPLSHLFSQERVKDLFARHIRDIECRMPDGAMDAAEIAEHGNEYVESWIDAYRAFRLVPDAYFVLDAAEPGFRDRKDELESITGQIDMLDHVSLFVCIEADLSSALSNDKLVKYGEWWMWFDSTESMHLVVICIDRYGKHTVLDNNLLLHAFLAHVAESGRDNRGHGIQEAVEAD